MKKPLYLADITGDILDVCTEIRRELGKKCYPPTVMAERIKHKLWQRGYKVALDEGVERVLGESTYGRYSAHLRVADKVAVRIYSNKKPFSSRQRDHLCTYLVDSNLPIGLMVNFPKYQKPGRVTNSSLIPEGYR